jgi:hypothetical protein
MVFVPDVIISTLKFPSQDPIVLGAFGCMLISSGILGILGLRSPLKFVPLLLFQLFYKTIWFLAVLIPFLLANEMQFYVVVFILIFASYIIGDLISIPFSYIFAKESE